MKLAAFAFLMLLSQVATTQSSGSARCVVLAPYLPGTSAASARDETLVWDGVCTDGFADGYGTLYSVKGSSKGVRYEGHTKAGRYSFAGRYYFSPEDPEWTYWGYFKDGLQEGFGVYTDTVIYNGGNVTYEGDWQAGREHGYGTRAWEGSDWYEGNWVRGAPKGQGRYYHAGHRQLRVGEFDGYFLNGPGAIYFQDGDIIKGVFERNGPQGPAEYIVANGDVLDQVWSKGEIVSQKLRMRRPNHSSEVAAFWAGVALVAAAVLADNDEPTFRPPERPSTPTNPVTDPIALRNSVRCWKDCDSRHQECLASCEGIESSGLFGGAHQRCRSRCFSARSSCRTGCSM